MANKTILTYHNKAWELNRSFLKGLWSLTIQKMSSTSRVGWEKKLPLEKHVTYLSQHFCLKWLIKSSKQLMMSPPAPPKSAEAEPSGQQLSPHWFPTPKVLPLAAWQDRGPPHPFPHQNDLIPAAFVFSVTGSFKTARSLRELHSLGTSSRSLVSVTYTICLPSMLMPLFPETSFAASTYSRSTRNTRISNLRKPSRASIFQVQVPPLMWLKCSADDRLMFQCSFLEINSQEHPFCLRKPWNCFQLYHYQKEFWLIFYFKVYKKATQFLPSCCGCILFHVTQWPGGHGWAARRCSRVLDQCRSVVHLTNVQQMEIAPLACR